MEQDPIQNDARRARRVAQLGERPACTLCGCPEFDALLPVKRRLLERHHLAGRNHDPHLTVALCRNCHARLTEQLRRSGADMEKQSTLLERIVAVLRAVGTALKAVGEALIQWAEKLARLAVGLDARWPEWRDMPEVA